MKISWNTLELGPPPNRSILTPNQGLSDLKKICSNFAEILGNQSALHAEAALLSRIIYRMKTKFRGDKGFKTMEKVNRCLLQYLKLNLASTYSNFASCIRISIDGSKNNIIYAPTKQMFEYLLLRTQGFTKLICRVVQLCQVAANYLMNRLDIGHSWNIALVGISIIARIWSISKYLVLAACEHYNKIIPYLGKLECAGAQWTNEVIDFPKNLKTWLNVEWLTGDYSCNETKKKEVNKNSLLLNKVFGEMKDENVAAEEDDDVTDLSLFHHNIKESSTDIGERVSRATIKKSRIPNHSKNLSDKKVKRVEEKMYKKNVFDDVKTADDLIQFIVSEEDLRIKKPDAAVTKNLDSFQFHLLRKKVYQITRKLNKIEQKELPLNFEVFLSKSKRKLNLYINC